jgi:ABC-type sugar transport system ATPase subunit
MLDAKLQKDAMVSTPPAPTSFPTPVESANASDVLLSVRGIEKHFDGVYALRGASIDIAVGQVHVLMGENGAGKSTLAKVMAGIVQPDAGEIHFNGKPVRLTHPREMQAMGISIILQELDLFHHLSVAENIVIGHVKAETGTFVRPQAVADFCRPFLNQVGFTHDPHTFVEELSVGQMQLVAIARALSMDAKVILMDEPTSALDEHDVARLFGLIRKLTARGVAIVYVSHKMQEIFEIADQITVMRDGCIVATSRADHTNVQTIINQMVGRELSDRPRRQSRRTDRTVLRVKDLSSDKLHGVSFELAAGEVLGIAGLVGAGRSELGAALFGLDAVTGGTIELDEKAYKPRNVRDAIARGLGLLPEDRKGQGLMMQMSVQENCTMSLLPRLATRGFIGKRDENASARAVLGRTRTKTASYHAPVSSLSGGNQQKVLLGRWLQVDPEVLFLDDPTRGIDVGAKRDIYEIIDELAVRGKGLLFVSSELPELLANCDRILVMHDGRVTRCVDAGSSSQEQIMALATKSEDAQVF